MKKHVNAKRPVFGDLQKNLVVVYKRGTIEV